MPHHSCACLILYSDFIGSKPTRWCGMGRQKGTAEKVLLPEQIAQLAAELREKMPDIVKGAISVAPGSMFNEMATYSFSPCVIQQKPCNCGIMSLRLRQFFWPLRQAPYEGFYFGLCMGSWTHVLPVPVATDPLQ